MKLNSMFQTINLDFDMFATKAEQGRHLLVWLGNFEAAKACALIDEDAIGLSPLGFSVGSHFSTRPVYA